MKTKKKIGFFLSLIIAITVLSSCSGGEPAKPDDPDVPPVDPQGGLLDRPDWAIDKDELVSYSSEAYYDSNVFTDVEENFVIELVDTSAEQNLKDPSIYIKIYDSQHIVKSQNYTYNNGIYELTPKEPYEKGRFYTAELSRGCPFIFLNKNPELKEVHFNIPGEESNVFNVKKEVKRFLLSDVISISEVSSSEEDEYVLISKNKLNLNEGDQFLFWNGDKMDNESFFGEFISEAQDRNVYKVNFKSPDLTKVFEENGVNLYVKDYAEGNIEDLELVSKPEIEQQIKGSEAFQNFLYTKYLELAKNERYILKANSFMDYIDNFTVNVDFGFKWPGWTFEIGVEATVPLEKCTITFVINYYRLSKTSVSAEFKLRKMAGIPYWADMSFDMTEDVDSSFTISFSVGAKIPTTGDKKEDYGNLRDYIKKEVADLKQADQKFKDLTELGDKSSSFDGNKLTLNLGKGRWPIFYVFDFYISFTFDISLNAQAIFNYSYASHSVSHIIEYKSNEDEVKGGTNKESYESSCHDIAIGGKLSIDIGVSFTFGLGVVGLEKYIHIQGKISLGVYFTAQVFGVISIQNYDAEQSTVQFNFSGFIEVGFYFKTSLNLKFFVFSSTLTPYSYKKPFASASNDIYIISAKKCEELVLTEDEYALDDSQILSFYAFSPKTLSNSEQKFSATEKITVYDKGKNKNVDMFKYTFKEGRYIYYEDGKLKIKASAPAEFFDTLYIDVPEQVYKLEEGETHLREVPIHYTSCESRPIFIDDEFIKYDYRGKTFILPEAPKKDGYRFYGYHLEGTDFYYYSLEEYVIERGSTYLEPVKFYSTYNEIITFTVNFYDGFGNLINTQKVERGEAAKAPRPEERDKYMSGYKFIRWSCDFSKVFYNLDVYGIYGGVENEDEINSLIFFNFNI